MRAEYCPPKTMYSFNEYDVKVFGVSVVAETEHTIFLAPNEDLVRFGRSLRPIVKYKRSYPTFHTFHEAKHELMEVLNRRIAGKTRALKAAEDDYARAASLEQADVCA